MPVRAFLTVLMLVTASAHLVQAQEPTVQTMTGLVAGSTADGVRTFTGIPYAQPPMGPLRWKPPQPVGAWTGTRDATKFGNDCMQKPLADSRAPGVSEDCLTLNVWAPITVERLPVMVWVYGGGFVEGSASLPLYDGARLAKQGVIVVSLNYRTGVFGFLAHRLLSCTEI